MHPHSSEECLNFGLIDGIHHQDHVRAVVLQKRRRHNALPGPCNILLVLTGIEIHRVGNLVFHREDVQKHAPLRSCPQRTTRWPRCAICRNRWCQAATFCRYLSTNIRTAVAIAATSAGIATGGEG
jgi:hypothetical protein